LHRPLFISKTQKARGAFFGLCGEML